MGEKEKRTWQPRELRMVSEFLVKYYAKYPYKMRVRLGTLHPDLEPEQLNDSEKRLVGVTRRWADCIVFQRDRLILIEAAIRPHPGDISLLELYKYLIPHTPELEEYKHLPIMMLLVYAIEDPLLVMMARDRGIKCTYFKPDWIDDYLKLLYPRERRAPLTHPSPE